ncbi:nucleotide pyrophosphohydrolase [Teredinibacter franksiae]|uniref:nucleotide pyrophosphohydrolase n=1 Tax=Teredinibacter franksiae TaxID=2761453 RepID=UPI001626C054|nr:nucleotide pyrophosphohydrolase [Teredinibacter franksiae]
MKDFETLADVQQYLRGFAKVRDWEKFHSPKNLAMALSVEASELMEIFQWLSEDASFELQENTREAVASEMADVLLYLVRMADQLNIDLMHAATNKAHVNEARYPAEQVRGSAKKYNQY